MIIDAFFRFSAITLLLFVVIVLIRDLRHSKSTLYLLLSCLSLSALFLGFTPEYLQLPSATRIVFRFMDVPHLIFVWLFALSLFQKDFKLKKSYLLFGILYSASILYVRLVQFGFVSYLPSWWVIVIQFFSVVLMLHMIVVTLKGRGDDLLESRRKSRIYFILLIAFIGITSALVEFLSVINNWNLSLPTIKLIAIWPAIIWLCFWLFSINSHKFSFDEFNKSSKQELSARDSLLLKKLETEIIENKAYLKNGLTISTLANKLGVSPHRLRDFINQTLGHENFSTYINAFRIQAIKEAFSNSDNAHIPILTIAMQHGFNSLSPFNRAFKAIQGITPSEYRQNLK